jgi:hypothetical protein
MASTGLAPLAICPLIQVELADLVFTLDYLHRLRRPESKCIDRGRGPASAGHAVAVANPRRIACDDDLDGTTKALPFIGLLICAHESLPFAWRPDRRVVRVQANLEKREGPTA